MRVFYTGLLTEARRNRVLGSRLKIAHLRDVPSLTSPVHCSERVDTIHVASVFNANRLATIELFTEQFGPSVCVAKAHVIYTFAS
jgi:hypothetical protein